jgi:hypothetical protein
MSKAVRVFISSTFRDMHAERDHLVTSIFPELRERLEWIGLAFFDVDLRWGVPETGIDGEQANSWAYCRQWIERVEPFFVGILGQRYGWRPPESEILVAGDRAAYRDMSITEMEIRYGALGRSLERRSFFYLRDTQVPPETAPEVYREFVDPDSQERLASLKREVHRSGRPVRTYSCRWTGSGFEEMEAFGRYVLEDLWSGVLRDPRYVPREAWGRVLGTDFENDPRYADESEPVEADVWKRLVEEVRPRPADPLVAEADQMEAFSRGLLRWFHGREESLSGLWRFVEGDGTDDRCGLCVVKGRQGQGKSALLARFSQQLSASSPLSPTELGDLIVTHFVGASERSADLQPLLQRLIGELDRSGIQWPAEEGANEDVDSLRRRLAGRLEEYDGDRRIVLIIDAVNQLTGGHDLAWLPLRFGPSVRVLLSCIDDPAALPSSTEAQVLSQLRSRGSRVQWLDLGPLEKGDVRSIVVDFLHEYCKELDEDHIATLESMEQARNPLYLMVMLHELRTLGGNDMNLVVPQLIAEMRHRYPDTIRLFDWVLTRLEVFGEEAVKKWCTYLSLGRSGMTSGELRALLQRILGDSGLRASSRIERGIRRYLQHRGRQLDFFHSQLREAVRRRYLESREAGQAANREIAEYYVDLIETGQESARGLADAHFYVAQLASDVECSYWRRLLKADYLERRTRFFSTSQSSSQPLVETRSVVEQATSVALDEFDYDLSGQLLDSYHRSRIEMDRLLGRLIDEAAAEFDDEAMDDTLGYLSSERSRWLLMVGFALRLHLAERDGASRWLDRAAELVLPEEKLADDPVAKGALAVCARGHRGSIAALVDVHAASPGLWWADLAAWNTLDDETRAIAVEEGAVRLRSSEGIDDLTRVACLLPSTVHCDRARNVVHEALSDSDWLPRTLLALEDYRQTGDDLPLIRIAEEAGSIPLGEHAGVVTPARGGRWHLSQGRGSGQDKLPREALKDTVALLIGEDAASEWFYPQLGAKLRFRFDRKGLRDAFALFSNRRYQIESISHPPSHSGGYSTHPDVSVSGPFHSSRLEALEDIVRAITVYHADAQLWPSDRMIESLLKQASDLPDLAVTSADVESMKEGKVWRKTAVVADVRSLRDRKRHLTSVLTAAGEAGVSVPTPLKDVDLPQAGDDWWAEFRPEKTEGDAELVPAIDEVSVEKPAHAGRRSAGLPSLTQPVRRQDSPAGLLGFHGILLGFLFVAAVLLFVGGVVEGLVQGTGGQVITGPVVIILSLAWLGFPFGMADVNKRPSPSRLRADIWLGRRGYRAFVAYSLAVLAALVPVGAVVFAGFGNLPEWGARHTPRTSDPWLPVRLSFAGVTWFYFASCDLWSRLGRIRWLRRMPSDPPGARPEVEEQWISWIGADYVERLEEFRRFALQALFEAAGRDGKPISEGLVEKTVWPLFETLSREHQLALIAVEPVLPGGPIGDRLAEWMKKTLADRSIVREELQQSAYCVTRLARRFPAQAAEVAAGIPERGLRNLAVETAADAFARDRPAAHQLLLRVFDSNSAAVALLRELRKGSDQLAQVGPGILPANEPG